MCGVQRFYKGLNPGLTPDEKVRKKFAGRGWIALTKLCNFDNVQNIIFI
jgi:hypothetical protein